MTIFKKIGKNKYFQGVRKDLFTIESNHGEIFDNHIKIQAIEKEALNDYKMRIRFIYHQPIYCMNIYTKKIKIIQPQQILEVLYYNFECSLFLCKSGECLFNIPQYVEILPIKQAFFVQSLSPSGIVVRSDSEDCSPPLGIIPYYSTVLIKGKKFAHSNYHQIRLELMDGGFIPQNEVRLIGYDTESQSQWKGCTMEIIPNYFCAPKNNSPQCIICQEKTINSTFVHGNSGHSLCCYPCAQNIFNQKEDPQCPICRQNLDQVILNYTTN